MYAKSKWLDPVQYKKLLTGGEQLKYETIYI